MVRIRHGTFETNSSSVHALVWREHFYKDSVSEEAYTETFTNIIDLSLSNDYIETFPEKISKLFMFLDSVEYDDIMMHARRNYGSDKFDIDEAYCENFESNDIKFRSFYKKIKKDLLATIEEITNKKVKFINENEFSYDYYDITGFAPNKKDEIKEFLLNKDMILVFEDDNQIEESSFVTEEDMNLLIDKRNKEELSWFDWFKIEKEF